MSVTGLLYSAYENKKQKNTPSVVSTPTPAPVTAGGFTLGLDLGDRSHYVCVLDAAGEILHEGRLLNDRVALAARVSRNIPPPPSPEVEPLTPLVLPRYSLLRYVPGNDS